MLRRLKNAKRAYSVLDIMPTPGFNLRQRPTHFASNKNTPGGRLREHIANNGADFEHDPVREILAAAKRKRRAYRLLLSCPPKTYRPRSQGYSRCVDSTLRSLRSPTN